MTVALAAKGDKADGPETSIAEIAAASAKDRVDLIRDIVAIKT